MTNRMTASSRRSIAQLARNNAQRAIDRLVKAMDDPDPRVAIDAAKHVLDRAIGKPIAMSADVTDRLDEFTDEEMDAAIRDLEGRVAAARRTAGEAEPSPGGDPPGTLPTIQ